jgi:predicted permease
VKPSEILAGGIDDLRVAARGLLRAPLSILPAIACLALGLGGATLLAGVLDALLFRPPAGVSRADSVVRLATAVGASPPQAQVSYPVYTDLAGKVAAFSDLAAFAAFEGSLGRGPGARRVRSALVSPGFFQLLEVSPVRGRAFTPEEGDPRRPARVAVLSFDLWQRAFGGDEKAIGRQIDVGRERMTVVGVLPARFAGLELEPVDLWLPLGAGAVAGRLDGWWNGRGISFLQVVGRLRPGVSAALAAEQATAIHRQAYAALGDLEASARSVGIRPVQPGYHPESSREIRVALGMTATAFLVLAIACANVSSLLLVRGIERRRELALRLSLGSDRLRLARLLILESLLVALLGALGAIALVGLGRPLVRAFLLPPGSSVPSPIDPRTLAVLLVASLAAGLLAGMTPALWAGRQGLAAILRSAEHGGSRLHVRLRSLLLVLQVASTFVLLAGAGLFLASLENLAALPLGMAPGRVLLAKVDFAREEGGSRQATDFYQQALERARQLPGVTRAGLAAGIPFRSSFGAMLWVPGYGEVDSTIAPGGLYYDAITEGYLATLGTAVHRGRDFTAGDGPGNEKVALVDETLARALWPGQGALGRCFKLTEESAPCRTVVGVVADTRRQRFDEPPTARFYLPLAQTPELAPSALFVRVAGNPEASEPALRGALQAVAPDLPWIDVFPLSDLLDRQLRPYRQGAAVFSLFGSLALVLAALGLVAAVSHAVATRKRETGIRLALGGRPTPLALRVWLEQLAPIGAGLILGLFVALMGAPLLAPLLFGVAPRDPAVFAGAVILTASAAVVALLPAFRGSHLEVSEIFRREEI